MTALELYGMGFLGWVLYNMYLLDKRAELFDKNGDGLSWKETTLYLRKNWPGITFSFILTLAMVVYHLTEEVYDYIMHICYNQGWLEKDNYPFIKAFHLLTGALAAFVQFLINKISRK